MFNNTIDKKPFILDNNGNLIVDLALTIFAKQAAGLNSFSTVKLNSYYQMRADKVAWNEYGDTDYTEFILKYSGISNPFSLDLDDVLLIPDPQEAEEQLRKEEEIENVNKNQVQTYYKFTNKDFKSDSTSYDKLAKKEIKSGVLKPEENGGFMVPYISDDGMAITIKNGRMYFGTDAGNTASPDDYAELVATALDKKCAANGMSLTDFVRASIVNAGVKTTTD